MPIIYNPTKLLKKIAPQAKIKKLMTADLSLKKTALNFVSDIPFIDKKEVATTALKVIKNYKERVKDGESKSDLKSDPALLIQRVEQSVVTQVKDEIAQKYSGEFYVWLPSDAEEADPEHQLNYGKTFQVGDGEMPGDRFGCRCGMEILVPENQLNLGDE